MRHVGSELNTDHPTKPEKKVKLGTVSGFAKAAARHQQKFQTQDEHHNRGSKVPYSGGGVIEESHEEDHCVRKHKPHETIAEFGALSHEPVTPHKHHGQHHHPPQESVSVVQYTAPDGLSSALKSKLKEYHIVNKVLQVGEAFGEKALTNPNAKRSASILTNSDCEFIILHKDDFLKIFARFSLHNKRKIDFLRANIPDMDQVSSRATFEDYMYSVQQLDLVKGNIITEEGYSGKKIYILAQGTCTVHKELPDRRPESLKMMTKPRFETIQVNEIGPGTMIGEELIFTTEKKYKYTVKVIQTKSHCCSS